MSTLANALIEAGLRHRLVTERTLAGLLGPGKARRYGLVNRALMDLVALRRCAWQGLAWLSEGLRIDADALAGLSRQDFETLSGVYRHKAANAFLAALQDAVVGGNTTAKEAAQLVSAATAAPISGASSTCRVS